MIDLDLNPPNHDKRKRGEEETDANLPEGSKWEDLADGRVEPVVEQRNHRENEDPVDHVYLLWQKGDAEEMEVHLLALDRPFAAAALVPKRPEDHRKDKDLPD